MTDGDAVVPQDIAERIQLIIAQLEVSYRRIREVGERIEQVEQSSYCHQLPRVRFAARGAFAKISASSAKLVECHRHLSHILDPPPGDLPSGVCEHD